MHRDKEDGLHGDPSFRSRDLTALDHSVLDGDMFLQVSRSTSINNTLMFSAVVAL
jgi:hypothetical protein